MNASGQSRASAPGAAPVLECLGVVAAPLGTTVHVKAPGQMFGLPLERALYRIDEFKDHDQGIVLAMLPLIYSIPLPADPSIERQQTTSL